MVGEVVASGLLALYALIILGLSLVLGLGMLGVVVWVLRGHDRERLERLQCIIREVGVAFGRGPRRGA